VLVRVIDGVLKKGQKIRMMGTGAVYDVERVGVFTPKMVDVDELGPGEIGFFTASIKEVADTRVGDTITDERKPTATPAAGLQAGAAGGVLRPLPGRCGRVRGPARRHGQAALNDASFSYEMETSAALGFGFRCGFLGLLHLEIIQERLSASSTST
jgi:GTP-binding protein LepA